MSLQEGTIYFPRTHTRCLCYVGEEKKKEPACEDALFQGGRDNEASSREIAQKAVTDLKQIIREHI